MLPWALIALSGIRAAPHAWTERPDACILVLLRAPLRESRRRIANPCEPCWARYPLVGLAGQIVALVRVASHEQSNCCMRGSARPEGNATNVPTCPSACFEVGACLAVVTSYGRDSRASSLYELFAPAGVPASEAHSRFKPRFSSYLPKGCDAKEKRENRCEKRAEGSKTDRPRMKLRWRRARDRTWRPKWFSKHAWRAQQYRARACARSRSFA